MKKYFLLSFLLALSIASFAQQPLPIDMVFEPENNKFSLSGVGGGNLGDFTTDKASASGQLVIDINIYTFQKKRKDKTISLSAKYNPLIKNNLKVGDSILMNKIIFIDNQYMLFAGLHWHSMRDLGDESKIYHSFFIDMGYVPYTVKSVNPKNKGFANFNITSGMQFGLVSQMEIGTFGANFAFQGNYIYIYDSSTDDTSFDELLKSTKRLSRNYVGGGAKITIQINDFAIYLEGRQYYPLDNKILIKDFSNRPVFSIGGVATGTIFRTKND